MMYIMIKFSLSIRARVFNILSNTAAAARVAVDIFRNISSLGFFLGETVTLESP